jgi:hypothetical protein
MTSDVTGCRKREFTSRDVARNSYIIYIIFGHSDDAVTSIRTRLDQTVRPVCQQFDSRRRTKRVGKGIQRPRWQVINGRGSAARSRPVTPCRFLEAQQLVLVLFPSRPFHSFIDSFLIRFFSVHVTGCRIQLSKVPSIRTVKRQGVSDARRRRRVGTYVVRRSS